MKGFFFSISAFGLASLAPLACTAGSSPLELSSREDTEAHIFSRCQDRKDNDLDGLTDCEDPDCALFLVCGGEPTEGDVVDGDDVSDSAGSEDTATVADTASGVACQLDEECDPNHGILCQAGGCQIPDDSTIPPSSDAFEAMGMVLHPALVAPTRPIADPIGSLCGVVAREHGSVREAVYSRDPYGYTFQSTELAYRYLCRFGTELRHAEGDRLSIDCTLEGDQLVGRLRADRWFDATGDPVLGALVRYPSGGDEPPRPGDVVVWDVAPAGHVALVTRVLLNDEAGLVEVLEQGLKGATHRYRVEVSEAQTYTIPGARGWLRAPDAPVGCGLSGDLELVEVIRDPSGADLLVVEADVHAEQPIYINRVALVDESGVERAARGVETTGASDLSLRVAIGLQQAGIDKGQHALTLTATPLRLEHSFVASLDEADFYYDPEDIDASPTRGDFESAGVMYGVPPCLLEAVAHVASGWRQSARSPLGAVGIMQIAPDDLVDAATLIGLDVARLGEDSEIGRVANIRAGAALLARLFEDSSPTTPRAALEGWWEAVAALGGDGADGDQNTSNFAYRVFAALAEGVHGRVPRIPGLDVAVLAPVVQARPATALELALGDVLPGDAALAPHTEPLYLRRFALTDTASLPTLHRCDGPCATETCEAAECVAEAELTCVEDTLVWRDSCGAEGAVVATCGHETATCGLALCGGAQCREVLAPDGTGCEEVVGGVCSAGICAEPSDVDGDGYYSDHEPFDCVGHDNDRFIYPDAPELLDIRDNDCDGQSDDVGYLKLHRYRKVWAPDDWEHRYSATPISYDGWVKEDHWIGIYPEDICESEYGPDASEPCFKKKNDSEVELWGGFVLSGLMQCTGVFTDTGKHVSLLLSEGSHEFGTYHSSPFFTCTRLGYVPGVAAQAAMPSLVYTYRHRASFVSGVSDHMWSVVPNDGAPKYDVHTLSFAVLAGE